MYKISTDPLFGTIKVSGCGFLSVPPYLGKKQMCIAFEEERKFKIDSRGAMCRHK